MTTPAMIIAATSSGMEDPSTERELNNCAHPTSTTVDNVAFVSPTSAVTIPTFYGR